MPRLLLAPHPLYAFAGDSAPGDINGQGIGDVWFLVSPEGEPVEGTVDAASASAY